MEYFKLNNGIEMPMAGIGVFMMTPDQAEAAVESALRSGIRLIDTANGYMNESGTGSTRRRRNTFASRMARNGASLLLSTKKPRRTAGKSSIRTRSAKRRST